MTTVARNPIGPGWDPDHLALDLALFAHRPLHVARQRATPPRRAVASSAIHAAHPELAPFVEAALPPADEPPLTAREIYARVGYGRLGTVRLILAGIAREGRAAVTVDQFRRVHTINRYRRAQHPQRG